MEILLERTSLKLLVGDMWDPCWIYPSWINDQVTTGKQQWGDSILNQTCSRIWIDGYFCKTFQCANLPSFKHIDCVFFLKTKVPLMEMCLKCKTLVVSKKCLSRDTRVISINHFSHQSVNINSPIHSIVLSALRRSDKRTCLVWWLQSGFFGRLITTSWKFLSRRVFFKEDSTWSQVGPHGSEG